MRIFICGPDGIYVYNPTAIKRRNEIKARKKKFKESIKKYEGRDSIEVEKR